MDIEAEFARTEGAGNGTNPTVEGTREGETEVREAESTCRGGGADERQRYGLRQRKYMSRNERA